MNVLSLFDGIGTGFLALKNAGITIDNYYASEIDEKAIYIAKKNFPQIAEIGDVKKIDIKKIKKIDLIIGGSPCQGFSRNGKHLNFDDKRSALFFKFVEVLEDIKKQNPEVLFMLENVKMKKEWEDIITEFLEVKPITIDSRIHTVQARERTYWTNIKGVTLPQKENCTIREIAEKRDLSKYISINGVLFDPRISERERAGGMHRRTNQNKTSNKSGIYHCGRRRRNKFTISNKQNTSRQSDKREITNAGLFMQCLLFA